MKINNALHRFIIVISLCLLSQWGFAAAGSSDLFVARENYCKTHSCSYEKSAPGTVLIIHGMNSSLNTYDGISNKPNGSYISLMRYLKDLSGGKNNFRVYGIDYNSDGKRAAGTVRVQPLLNPVSSNCTAEKNWQNCLDEKNMWESANLFTTETLAIRTVSEALSDLLKKMAKENKITNPVTIIAHSMGGLITRDLIYHSNVSTKTGYEDLRDNGIVLNEVILLGVPHDHGFTGAELHDYRKLSCKIMDRTLPLIEQFCMLTDWVNQQHAQKAVWADNTKLEINRLDFPQIHWVSAAGMGMSLSDGTPGDGMVSLYSALYNSDGKNRFHETIGLKTSLSHYFESPIPADLSAGYPAGTDAIHENIRVVGLYPDAQSCHSSNLKYPSVTCTGFFQYVVPQTTLCLLPGYSEQNAYYQKNPAFSPRVWGCLD